MELVFNLTGFLTGHQIRQKFTNTQHITLDFTVAAHIYHCKIPSDIKKGGNLIHTNLHRPGLHFTRIKALSHSLNLELVSN